MIAGQTQKRNAHGNKNILFPMNYENLSNTIMSDILLPRTYNFKGTDITCEKFCSEHSFWSEFPLLFCLKDIVL